MKISFIATVLNEENNIEKFLYSVVVQSRKADQIIIVDGGSTDRTVSRISSFGTKIKLIIKKGNRSIGRNEAIRQATGDIIVCSDAGCILDKNWIKGITEPFREQDVDVVAGYYRGEPKNSFEKCIIPYFLVMEDRVDPNNFLPATRSMAFKKSIWERVGGFPEKFSNNEDYIFARNLKRIKAKIVFEKDAIAYWLPKENLKEVLISFYRFAKGDTESGIFRPKVIILFMRYFIGLILLFTFVVLKIYIIFNTLYLILILYILWSIFKNYKYVRRLEALYYLPLIQISSDLAIIIGTAVGLLRRKKAS
ncbi:MAG: glycosyltransferase [Candidatus Levybacteria bacterium]|nr:glycosyltransferase [Candidatus Levybacteria bacterium]